MHLVLYCLLAAGEKPVPFDAQWLEPYFRKGPLQAAVERFRLDDWTGAVDGLTRAKGVGAEKLPARFLLAVARENAGQCDLAGPIFEELWDSYPLLRPYHAAHAARCRARRGDTAGAIEWAARVPEGSVPEADAALVKLDALVMERRWAEIETATARFMERFAGGPRRAEVLFRRAEALEALGRAGEAPPLYIRIWAETPGETWSTRAAERLEALAQAALPDEAMRLRTRAAGDWITRGMIQFDRNQNTDSEQAFGAALAATGLDPALTCKAKFHRAQSVWKQRQRPRAAPLFVEAETACRDAGDTDLRVKALYQGARCLASAGDRAGAVALYAKIEAEHPEHSYADDARLRAAEVKTDEGDDAAAELLLKEIPTRYPRGDLLGESLWRLAFAAYRAAHWDEALAFLDENLRRITREEIWYAEGRAHYWKARIHEKQGARSDARAAYEKAVREYPLSVYALMSLERMRTAFPEARRALMTDLRRSEGNASWTFAPRPAFGEPGFKRAVELARMGMGAEARRELGKLGLSAPEGRDSARKAGPTTDDRQDVYWMTAILLDRGRLWSASHAIPRYTLNGYRLAYPTGRGADEWRLAYPRAFPELVASHSLKNKVPEALQLAIMREESGFSPRIESFANALGLTQMLVRTAQRFAASKITRDTLLDPAHNVELGSKFLGFLLEHFKGAAPLAISGYNAGEAAVDRWLRERGNLELDEFIETIPYDETRNYTKRVLASYAAYSWLYFPDRPVPQLSFKLNNASPTRAGRPAPRRR